MSEETAKRMVLWEVMKFLPVAFLFAAALDAGYSITNSLTNLLGFVLFAGGIVGTIFEASKQEKTE